MQCQATGCNHLQSAAAGHTHWALLLLPAQTAATTVCNQPACTADSAKSQSWLLLPAPGPAACCGAETDTFLC